MGWFPDQPGGLNRYLRELLAALQEADEEPRALVVGPAGDAPANVEVVAAAGDSLPRRLFAYARAAERTLDAELVDVHFPLYALAPVMFGRARSLPLVAHFHGPWGLEA